MMKRLVAVGVTLAVALSAGLVLAEAQKDPPASLAFETKMGTVTFDHAKHAERVKKDCKSCHDSLFKQDKTAPLGYKDAMHKKAEAAKTSCAACHNAGGAAFETKGNCAKCHAKKN